MARKDDFNPSVPLPHGLDVTAIRRAIDYIEKQLAELVEIYDERANVFSAIVGIFGTKALDSVSNYEKHRNIDTAQQRFPDLRRRGSGLRPSSKESLESGKPVIIWRVDVIFLQKSDWKYEKSGAGEAGGGRTHTFGVKDAARKLKDK